MIDQEQDLRDPMIRTAELFSRNQEDLALFFAQRELAVAGTDKRIRLHTIEPWEKDAIKPPFTALAKAYPGQLVVLPFMRTNLLSFITARDAKTGQNSTCLALKKAEVFDGGEYRMSKNQSEIAKYLGFEAGQTGKVEFLDGTDTLFITGAPQETTKTAITSSEADEALQSLFDN